MLFLSFPLELQLWPIGSLRIVLTWLTTLENCYYCSMSFEFVVSRRIQGGTDSMSVERKGIYAS